MLRVLDALPPEARGGGSGAGRHPLSGRPRPAPGRHEGGAPRGSGRAAALRELRRGAGGRLARGSSLHRHDGPAGQHDLDCHRRPDDHRLHRPDARPGGRPARRRPPERVCLRALGRRDELSLRGGQAWLPGRADGRGRLEREADRVSPCCRLDRYVRHPELRPPHRRGARCARGLSGRAFVTSWALRRRARGGESGDPRGDRVRTRALGARLLRPCRGRPHVRQRVRSEGRAPLRGGSRARRGPRPGIAGRRSPTASSACSFSRT